MDQIHQHGFDGVDIDFEGGTQMGGDYALQEERVPFAEFCKELGTLLHAEGKELGVATFHSPCWNAPNMAWFSDWTGYVDHARTMGYADDFEDNGRELLGEGTCWGLPADDPDAQIPSNYFRYSWKSEYVARTTGDTTMLSIGIGGDGGSQWAGKTATEHVKDILANPVPAGIAMWNYSGSNDPTWYSSAFWSECKKIHDLNPGDGTKAKKAEIIKKYRQEKCIFLTRNDIQLSLKDAGEYSLGIFDAAGRCVMGGETKHYNAGEHSIPSGSHNIAKGVYVVKLNGKNQNMTKKFGIY
jgi:hypothetical protein